MPKENNGYLAKNDRKEKDTHPDYSGSINVNGGEFWLSGWIREKEGRKYFSLAVKPKQNTNNQQQQQQEQLPF